MRDGHNQYAAMTGLPALREALAEKVHRLYGQQYDAASEVLITASASQGIYMAISALVHPGDEVIFFEPSFDSYAPIVRLQGATPIALKLQVPDFAVNWDEVRAAITPRTRMIIINTPHNPSGQVLNAADLDQLAALTRNTDIVILSDEVYEHIVFDGEPHHGMATHPQLAERSVMVSSFGKTYHVTGWRVGYCAGARCADGGDRQGASVFDVLCRYADAARWLRAVSAEPAKLAAAVVVLSAQARSAADAAAGFAVQAVTERRFVLYVGRLRTFQRRERQRDGETSDRRLRCGHHSAVGVLYGRHGQ